MKMNSMDNDDLYQAGIDLYYGGNVKGLGKQRGEQLSEERSAGAPRAGSSTAQNQGEDSRQRSQTAVLEETNKRLKSRMLELIQALEASQIQIRNLQSQAQSSPSPDFNRKKNQDREGETKA